MDDFKKYIKSKYETEVDPEFSDSDWNQFAAHSKAAKHRKFYKFAIPIFFASLLIFFIIDQSISENSAQEISSNIELESNESDPEKNVTDPLLKSNDLKTKFISTSNQPIKQNEISQLITAHIKQESGNNIKSSGVEAETKLSINSHSLDETSSYEQHNAAPNSSLNSSIDSRNTAEHIYSKLENRQGLYYVQASEISDINTLKLIPINVQKLVSKIDLGINSAIINPIKKSNALTPISYSINLFSGLAIANKRPNVTDEFASNFGVSLMAKTRSILRYRLDVQSQLYHYSSDEMGINVGIKRINPPSDEVAFTNAQLEENVLQLRLGMDVIFWKNKNWETYATATYGIQRTIKKDTEYNFEGENEDSMEDDLIIRLGDDEKMIKYGNTALGLGTAYNFKRFRIFSELNYNLSQGSIKQVIPHLFNAQIGVGYHF